MRALPPYEILRLWDQGQGQHSIDRALALLAAANPAESHESLAELTIGQRNANLLSLREHTFGTALQCYTECPQCAERLEFFATVTDLRVGGTAQELELIVNDIALRLRPLNSFDLAAAANAAGVENIIRILVERSLVEVIRDGEKISADDLTATAIEQIAGRMPECDPQAESLVSLDCPACGHHWQSVFDIVAFFWMEIGAEAKRLMREVHVLACAYGWNEMEILSLSGTRRQFYLDMVRQ